MDLRIEEVKCSKCGYTTHSTYKKDNIILCYTCQWEIVSVKLNDSNHMRKCNTCNTDIAWYSGLNTCDNCNLPTNINKIIDDIYLSDNRLSHKYEYLKSIGIKQILTIGSELKEHEHVDFKTMHIKINDNPNVNIRQYFEAAHLFMERAPTLVHCYAGISRSATLVISYIIKTLCLSAKQSISYCVRFRDRVSPNSGFRKQLEDYAKELGIVSVDSSIDSNVDSSVLVEDLTHKSIANRCLDKLDDVYLTDNTYDPPFSVDTQLVSNLLLDIDKM
jgi:protein-tyrosine phosphatase